MKIALSLFVLAATAEARLGSKSKFAKDVVEPSVRKLQTETGLCMQYEGIYVPFTEAMLAPKKDREDPNLTGNPFEGTMNLYEWALSGEPFPTCGDIGQNEGFQGSPSLYRQGSCERVNICHGNAGFGWNAITVDRDAIGVDNNGHGGHAQEEHNNRNNKRPDYFPGTTSVPNPRGAGINGYLDGACNFHCPEGVDNNSCQDLLATDPAPTEAPTNSPTLPDETASPTQSPTIAPTTEAPTPAPTIETFPVGTTVQVNGEDCILLDDCSCQVDDADDLEEDANTRNTDENVPVGTKGDPHFLMWNGRHFDFHGGCDLVLADVPEFNNGQGLKIHIRTKVKTWFSYVERVVVQIGKDKLEVKGGFDTRRFWHNGHILPGRRLTKKNGLFPVKVGGYDVHFQTQRNHISWKVSILLPDDQVIALRTIKDYMRVDIERPLEQYFGTAQGLMGNFANDDMVARDGTVMGDADSDAYAMTWQVQNEPSLFIAADGTPQFPEQCEMPTVERSTKRLLEESDVTYEAAEKACAHLAEEERDDCIYDVIATSDIEFAGAY